MFTSRDDLAELMQPCVCLQTDFNLSLVEYELVNVPPEAS